MASDAEKKFNALTPTQQKVALFLIAIIAAVEEATATSAVGGLPSGELYATLMTCGMTLETYQAVIAKCCESGLIRQSNNLLIFTGPPSGRFAARVSPTLN